MTLPRRHGRASECASGATWRHAGARRSWLAKAPLTADIWAVTRRVGALCAPSAGAGRKTMKTNPASGLSGIAPDASINPLVFDLLEWLAISPRPYTEVMDVW